jgi:hypothetical protein
MKSQPGQGRRNPPQKAVVFHDHGFGSVATCGNGRTDTRRTGTHHENLRFDDFDVRFHKFFE